MKAKLTLREPYGLQKRKINEWMVKRMQLYDICNSNFIHEYRLLHTNRTTDEMFTFQRKHLTVISRLN